MDSKLPSAALSKPVCSCIRLFAGRQWGDVSVGKGTTFSFPLAFKKTVSIIIGDHYGITGVIVHFAANSLAKGSAVSTSSGDEPVSSYYIVIGV